MATFASCDGMAEAALENCLTSSLPRAVQRPCSTQNAAIDTSPERGGNNRSTDSTRSCCPPFTMSPA